MVSRLFRKLSLFQYFLALVLIALVVIMSSYLWHGDVLIHTDVARDLLVVREMVENKQVTLIGPRSSIPGVFHGALWYYIYLIPFILSHGDPLLMGWFWFTVVLFVAILFLFISHSLIKNLTISLLLTICFILLELPGAAGPTNIFFANLFAFVPFILFWRWHQKPSIKLAAIGWLTMGLLAQFQMAFIVPLALSWGLVFLWKIIKEKKWSQLFAPLFFILPFFTFIIFDLRHDFLQTNSFLTYIQTAKSDMSFYLRLTERISLAFYNGINLFGLKNLWLNLLIWFVFSFLAWRHSNKELKKFYFTTIYWYFSWWILTLAFSGTIWSFYFDPFVSILLLTVGVIASKSSVAKYLLIILTFFSIFQSRGNFSYSPDRFNSSSWKLLSNIAADSLSEQGVGYFLYSQDQFAYPLKYAFAFHQQENPNLKGAHFVKQPTTILIKSADNPDNPWSTSSHWQTSKININMESTYTKFYPYGYVLEKYLLDEKTLNEPVDPNLVRGLEFR